MKDTKIQKTLHLYHFERDIVIILLSIVLTIVFVRLGFLGAVLSAAQEQYYLGSFIGGIFFTSIFTIAPAAVVLGKIAVLSSPLSMALWGALGAMLGDAALFFFIRDVFVEDLEEYLKRHHRGTLFSYFHFGFLCWLGPLLGALIIASPLPDEMGLALMGLSRMKAALVLPLTFVLNFLGLLLIGYFAVSIS